MKWKTFIVGWGLALSLLLVAKHRPANPEPTVFSTILDLTHSVSADAPNWAGTSPTLHSRVTATHDRDGYFNRQVTFDEHASTHLDAPAHMMRGTWTVDQIPAERLVRPLVVIDIADAARNNSDYQLSVEDIASYEKLHGEIPLGSVVMAHTAWDLRWNSSDQYRNADANGTLHFPGFSLEAARFLVEARAVVGLGIDTLSVDPGNAPEYSVHRFCAARGVYHLENVANLGRVPPAGAIAAVTPLKLEGGSAAPVRILAMLK